MTAYLIAQIRYTLPAEWPEYKQRVSEFFAGHGGRYIVRGSRVEVLEGPHDGRQLIVLEFPSLDIIRTVWASPEYAALKTLGQGSGELDVWAVAGVD